MTDTSITPIELKERALEVEASALKVKGVHQAEGANASHAHSEIFFQTSSGFSYEMDVFSTLNFCISYS